MNSGDLSCLHNLEPASCDEQWKTVLPPYPGVSCDVETCPASKTWSLLAPVLTTTDAGGLQQMCLQSELIRILQDAVALGGC